MGNVFANYKMYDETLRSKLRRPLVANKATDEESCDKQGSWASKGMTDYEITDENTYSPVNCRWLHEPFGCQA